jgi:TRAP-type C4-dicarboxylate transport system permease small subunit
MLAADVSVNPNSDSLPGTDAFQKLLNGFAKLALLACLGGFLLGAAQWALGNRSNNYSQASDGKGRLMISLLGAFAIGASAVMINYFFGAGSAVHK